MNDVPHIPHAHETFVHIRIFIGMILGIAVTRLVTGLTRFIQHPGQDKPYFTHIAWVVFVLLFIAHFWWFEFALFKKQDWGFGTYFFLLVYAGTFAVIAALLFPDRIDEYNGFRGYFLARRRWLYSALLFLFVADVIDTLLKGPEYYALYYSWDYPLRQGFFIIATGAALLVESETYQKLLAGLMLLFQAVWIIALFDVLR